LNFFFFFFFRLLSFSPSSRTTFRCEPWFQNHLPLFPTSSNYCLSGFCFHYKYNPLQPLPSLFFVVFFFPCFLHCSCCKCLGIRWFECFQHDHTILVGGILQYLPLTMCVLFFLTTIKLCEEKSIWGLFDDFFQLYVIFSSKFLNINLYNAEFYTPTNALLHIIKY